jgi:hypothetical protein
LRDDPAPLDSPALEVVTKRSKAARTSVMLWYRSGAYFFRQPERITATRKSAAARQAGTQRETDDVVWGAAIDNETYKS